MRFPKPIAMAALGIVVCFAVWDELLYNVIPIRGIFETIFNYFFWISLAIILIDRRTRNMIFRND